MSGRCSRSINVIHRPISFVDRSSNDLEAREKRRRKKVMADEVSRFTYASSRQGNFYQKKKLYLNREKERGRERNKD